MTPDSKRFLHPEAIKRISHLDVRARYIVEGFLSGVHRSPYFGQSIEFLQHREYAPGDDLRHIDWKVWGKQDRYYVKQYEEDTNLRCTLLVDVSGSMRYGRGALSKYEYGCTIAASLLTGTTAICRTGSMATPPQCAPPMFDGSMSVPRRLGGVKMPSLRRPSIAAWHARRSSSDSAHT